MTDRQLQITYRISSQLGINQPFDGDSFGFMTSLQLVGNSLTLNSTLTVTADRRLHGTVVECAGLLSAQDVINITSKSDIRISCSYFHLTLMCMPCNHFYQ